MLLLSFLFAVSFGLSASAPPELMTNHGPIIGEDLNGGVRVFRSIPFGAAPVGSLRFRDPIPPISWSVPRDVVGLPNACPQLKLDGTLFVGNEDCLYLSLFLPPPESVKGPTAPIMFFIYGGAYVLGDAWEMGWYDGAALAKKGVIVVVANYRVGPFGFFASPALAAENPGGSNGNAALLDQVLALEWTRDNAAAFGGDATKVTIFGESAGAFSVAWHVASPRSKDLFSAAISESGSFEVPQFFQPLVDAVTFNTAYGAALGCGNADSAAALACLRTLSTERIMLSLADWLNPNWPNVGSGPAAISQLREIWGKLIGSASGVSSPTLPALAPVMPWGPAIDGVVLLTSPLAAVRAGTFNNVPMILGTNKNEGSIFIPIFPVIAKGVSFPPKTGDAAMMIEHAFDMYPAGLVRNLTNNLVLPAYPLRAYGNDSWAQTSDMVTHAVFTCSNRRTSKALVDANVQTWLYQFSYKIDWIETQLLPVLGTCEKGCASDSVANLFSPSPPPPPPPSDHTSELSFVFGNEWPSPLIHPFSANDHEISDAFMSYWTQFAYDHNPNSANINTSTAPLFWPNFSRATQESIQIERPISITENLEAELCDNVWDPFTSALAASNTRSQ
jgi:carboxylesterase type B